MLERILQEEIMQGTIKSVGNCTLAELPITMYKNRTENFHTSTESFPITLRVEDLMPILNVGRNTAYQLVRSGEIRSIRIGRQIRIPRQVLLDYLEQK